MAFRIAELIKASESVDGEERESACAECTELILRLWSMRDDWPDGPPMGRILSLLEDLDNQGRHRWTRGEPKDLQGLFRRLDDLGKEERDRVLDALVSRMDLTLESEWISEQGNHLSEEETKLYARLKSRQDGLRRNIILDDDEKPNLMEIDDAEMVEWLRGALEAVAGKRQAAIDSVTLEGESDRAHEDCNEDI